VTETPDIVCLKMNQLRTVREVARELRCSPLTIYRAIQRGELRARRLGEQGGLRVERGAVDEFFRPNVVNDEEENDD
jgi:excisionase family DNA binding protein